MKKMLMRVVVICFFMYLIWVFGITEKSFINKYQYMLFGTGGGGFAMLLYWLLFGSIGIATGGTAIGIGLIGQLLLGMFCGTGISSFILVLNNPNHFDYNWFVISGLVVLYFITQNLIGRWLDARVN